MKILFAAAEIAPLTKVGGLADVMRSLPAELIKHGHDVRVIVPKYGFVDYSCHKATEILTGFTVLALGECRKISVEQIELDGIPVYLLSADIFRRAHAVYGESEVEKFWVFCDCVSEVIGRLGWQPDIVHCNDWHTALIPMLARKNREAYRTIFTIHNIRYQGYFDEWMLVKSGTTGGYWNAGIPGMPYVPWNLMTQGILWADVINAVSPTFAGEILTSEGGYGMQEILAFRRDRLSGIRNGLGWAEYDPANDDLITAKYSFDGLDGKLINKLELEKVAGWGEDSGIPIVGMVARLDEQKGMDIIPEALSEVFKEENMRFVFLGRGSAYYEEALRRLESRYPANIRAFITFDNSKAHLIYAGSDLFLMPSKWEPCGLGQMIAMRYGTIPIVRKTGGLSDTVSNLSTDLKRGTGFMFDSFEASELTATIKRAAQSFADKAAWKRIVQRIMKQDLDWTEPVLQYELLYRKVLGMDADEKT